jgi:hypothetical protein
LLALGCVRPEALALPPWGDAQTAVVVHRPDGSPEISSSVLVLDRDSSESISALPGATFVLQYLESPAELGLSVGFASNGSGRRTRRPDRAFNRSSSDWSVIIEISPDLLPQIFSGATACERLVVGTATQTYALEMIRSVSLGDNRYLVADRQGRLYRLEVEGLLTALGALPHLPLAMTSLDGGASLLVFDDRGRLEQVDVETLASRPIVTSSAALGIPPGYDIPVASMLHDGERLHVAMTLRRGDDDQFRTATEVDGQWVRWENEDCGDPVNEPSQSNLLALAANGDIIHVGHCRTMFLRRTPNGSVREETLPDPSTGTPYVVRTLRGKIHIGTKKGRTFVEADGGFSQVSSFGSGTIDDFAPLGDDGLVIAIRVSGMSNTLKVWFPSAGPEGDCGATNRLEFTGIVADLLAQGDHYTAFATNPNGLHRIPIALGDE